MTKSFNIFTSFTRDNEVRTTPLISYINGIRWKTDCCQQVFTDLTHTHTQNHFLCLFVCVLPWSEGEKLVKPMLSMLIGINGFRFPISSNCDNHLNPIRQNCSKLTLPLIYTYIYVKHETLPTDWQRNKPKWPYLKVKFN